jgi:hypothetical protein
MIAWKIDFCGFDAVYGYYSRACLDAHTHRAASQFMRMHDEQQEKDHFIFYLQHSVLQEVFKKSKNTIIILAEPFENSG